MSRSNPFKKKQRSASQALLMYGEGLAEQTFLKYLKSLYARDSGVAVTIRNGKGGSAADVVINAANEPGSFDIRVVVLDNDKDETEMNLARSEAAHRGVELLENTPCLEATLLSVLNKGQSFASKGSPWCKHEFESKYLDSKKRTDLDQYPKFFPIQLLDEQRKKIFELDRLIKLMGR
jgi:hypothetical protein